MSIPNNIESLSTAAASNGPSGSDQRTLADDGLRQAYAFIAQLVNQGADIASASTITPNSTAWAYDVTGTTAITTIASTNSWNGRLIALQFDGALTLTHSSNLYLPGAANITTVAGDVALFVQRGSGSWQCISYLHKDGTTGASVYLPLAGGTLTGGLTGTTASLSGTFTSTKAGVSFIQNTSNSGANNDHQIINTSNTASSGARNFIGVGGSSAGDPYQYFNVLGVTDWTQGIDNSDSDTFKLSKSGTLGTNDYWAVTTDGRWYGTALHNNAGSVTGTTNQYVASGTYTPTLTNTTNIDASTAYTCQWIRVGNVVMVSGRVDIDPTAASAIEMGMSLPIASDLANIYELAGTGCSDRSQGGGTPEVTFEADTTNNRAKVEGLGSSTINTAVVFQFMYTVL